MRINKYDIMELKILFVKMFVWCIINIFLSNKKLFVILLMFYGVDFKLELFLKLVGKFLVYDGLMEGYNIEVRFKVFIVICVVFFSYIKCMFLSFNRLFVMLVFNILYVDGLKCFSEVVNVIVRVMIWFFEYFWFC